MAHITIRRAAALRDIIRNYKILADGRQVGTVGDGGLLRFAVAPGRHVVELSIDWCTSNRLQVTVAAGEECVLDCGNNVRNMFDILWYVTVKRREYLWLSHKAGDA